ncbi:DUF4397 domain-containing protein [Thalassomonas actiniarum]|uniref:DUF4397 domain-containing protein n=1 Tax=Thalassomonas actiniarum TaxID=485447 RepID=A0AAF0BY67_9GAMM|nr:DUF4397 domain-containing protein [Thalassomonas actiniarum]WDD97341.1 DUF4397 domain-containing protein [Thalassomonas actiniarum]
MRQEDRREKLMAKPLLPASLCAITLALLTGCGSGGSSSADDSGTIQLYNVSSNAPAILMTIDDISRSSASFGETTSNYTYEVDDEYELELSWQEDDDNEQVIYEELLEIVKDERKLLVVAGDIQQPDIIFYQFEEEDLVDLKDADDDEDDQFVLKFLNMQAGFSGVDVYLSENDETFEEAILLGQLSYSEMSQAFNYDTGDYKIYLTEAGNTEVLFETDTLEFPYSSQYIMALRENTGPGESPFAMDKISKSSSTVEYTNVESSAEFRVYNGLIGHGTVDLYLDEVDDSPEMSAIAEGAFSESVLLENGDYAMHLTAENTTEVMTENHLLTLNSNNDKTVFFYETEVDEDENDDDCHIHDDCTEVEYETNTLTVDNSYGHSLYDHQIQMIHLTDEYSAVDVYFVRHDETIDSAQYSLYSKVFDSTSVTLPNDSYDIYVTTTQNEGELILASLAVTLDEDSGDLFLVLQDDGTPDSEQFTLTLTSQTD